MIGYANEQKSARRGKIIAVGFVVIAVLFGVIFYLLSGKDTANKGLAAHRQASDAFMQAITNNEADKAFTMLTDAGKLEVGGETNWQQTVANSFSKTKTTPEFLSDQALDDPTGVYNNQNPRRLTYRLQMPNAVWQMSLTLVQQQNGWKVDRLSSEPQ